MSSLPIMILVTALVSITALSAGLSVRAAVDQPTVRQSPPVAGASAGEPAGRQAASREIAAAAIDRAVSAIGRPDGLYLTPKYHIPLPETLKKPIDTLASNYAATLPEAVERAINRAGEASAGPAGNFILQSLPRIALPETQAGSTDAVTTAIRSQAGQALRDALRPVMNDSLAKAGGEAAMQAMRARYEGLTGAPFPDFDLQAYALDSFLHVFFSSLSTEEQNIRTRPSLRTTETLKRAFAQ